jgi:hypothetical protein
MYNVVVCAYMWSKNGICWLGLHAENSETDHNCLVGDRLTTRLLIASEFYVHVMASHCVVYGGRRTRGDDGGSGEECTPTIETPKSIPQNREQTPNIIISPKAEKIKGTSVKAILVWSPSRVVG